MKKRRLIPGVQTRGPRPDSAARGRTQVRYVSIDTKKSLLRDKLDGRTVLMKLYRRRFADYTAHVGGELTVTMSRMIEQAVRLSLLSDACWQAVARQGVVKKGKPSGAFEGALRSAREEREVLRLLGLSPTEKRLPSLTEYLSAKDSEPDDADVVLPVSETRDG